MNNTDDNIIELDASGLLCPEPVMLLHKTINQAQSGDVIRMVSTDPSSERDVPKFCMFLNHELLSHDNEDDQRFIYTIRKN